MLILSRKPGESIVIDGRIVVKIMRFDGDVVKLGIEAPAEVPVHRQEVYNDIQQNNREAMTDTKVKLPQLSAPPASSGRPAFGNSQDSPAAAGTRITIAAACD
jgi:carbon storage regulator